MYVIGVCYNNLVYVIKLFAICFELFVKLINIKIIMLLLSQVAADGDVTGVWYTE